MKSIDSAKGNILVTTAIILMIALMFGLSFAFWLSVQAKGTVKNKFAMKSHYYTETGMQKAITDIQTDLVLQQKFLDVSTTDVYLLNLVAEDGAVIEISCWDLP